MPLVASVYKMLFKYRKYCARSNPLTTDASTNFSFSNLTFCYLSLFFFSKYPPSIFPCNCLEKVTSTVAGAAPPDMHSVCAHGTPAPCARSTMCKLEKACQGNRCLIKSTAGLHGIGDSDPKRYKEKRGGRQSQRCPRSQWRDEGAKNALGALSSWLDIRSCLKVP